MSTFPGPPGINYSLRYSIHAIRVGVRRPLSIRGVDPRTGLGHPNVEDSPC